MSEKVWNQREAWQKELEELEAARAKLLSLPEPPGHHKPLRTERITRLKRWLEESDPERPVSPATTAREWCDAMRKDETIGKDIQTIQAYVPEALARIVKFVASSQSEKLVGIGQEAAEKVVAEFMCGGSATYQASAVKKITAIYDTLVAERLAK